MTNSISASFVFAMMACSGVCSGACADFSWSDFAGKVPLQVNGNASLEKDALVLTPDAEGQNGSAFHTQLQKLDQGFDTTFVINIGGEGGKFGLGDGMTFFVQAAGPRYLGESGGGLGYAGPVAGLAIEIDTWPDKDDQIAVHDSTTSGLQQGGCYLSAEEDVALFAVGGFLLKDGKDHAIRILYASGSLSIFVDDLESPVMQTGYDLGNVNCGGTPLLNAAGEAWVGFTASTGGAYEHHIVKSWTFDNTIDAGCATIPGDVVPFECMAMNGSAMAADSNNGLQLTAAEEGQAGSGWNPSKVNLSCGFDTTFAFEMSGGADGMAFVIQDSGTKALGASGSGMGYGSNGPAGIERSLAIEIDTFGFGGEFQSDHISVQTNGTLPNGSDDAFSLGHAVMPYELDDGKPHSMRVQYSPGMLTIYVDDLGTPVLMVPVNLQSIDGESILDKSGMAWVGFTAGTGGVTQSHIVREWTMYVNTPSVADLNGDCTVNGADLGMLLSEWEQANSPADFNGDGAVNGADLGVLLSEWSS